MSRTVLEQLAQFRQAMEGKRFDKDSTLFLGVTGFLKSLHSGAVPMEERENLKTIVCTTFGLTPDELIEEVYGIQSNNGDQTGVNFKRSGYDPEVVERELDSLIPPTGFFRDYVEYTSRAEAPLAYHFFSSVVGVAAVCNRRIWVEMGYFNFYPATGVIILGPSGLRKTSAADIIVKMLQELQITPIYSEKLTPEALIDSMKGENATGLIYAPEMAVFLNKQKYNEGLVQLITRFMDCPDEWASGTIMRGKTPLRNIAISVLMCSTPDWFVTNIPEDTFGGGFVARNLLVVQESSSRCEPIPRPGDPTIKERLMMQLSWFHTFMGACKIGGHTGIQGCRCKFCLWYRKHTIDSQHPEHELLGTYYQRKQGHVVRLAMCLHIGTHYEYDIHTICEECFERAVKILDWNEKFLPNLFRQLFKSQAGQDAELILRAIRAAGGTIGHSNLIRKMQYKFAATQVRSIISSLKESNQLREENGVLGHLYILE
jgi:hypothetical protein